MNKLTDIDKGVCRWTEEGAKCTLYSNGSTMEHIVDRLDLLDVNVEENFNKMKFRPHKFNGEMECNIDTDVTENFVLKCKPMEGYQW